MKQIGIIEKAVWDHFRYHCSLVCYRYRKIEQVTIRQSKRKRPDMSNDIETYEASPKDSAEDSTVENEGVIRKRARMLSQAVLHIDRGTKNSSHEGSEAQ